MADLLIPLYLYEDWIRNFEAIWSTILLSQMKLATPYRTGRLRRALRAKRVRTSEDPPSDTFLITINKNGFYWKFQPGLADKYNRLFNANIEGMIAYASQQVGL